MKPDRQLERQGLLMPFPALVGQDSLKQALLLLAVNPRLNGLLVRGEKGTGKSTAARGLARLLPAIQVNEGCMFGCRTDRPDTWCDKCRADDPHTPAERRPPFETAPLGITEDQLLGTFDLERALKSGEVRFKPGLLARVNHGVLYVDEVNLLDDHIVDLLLDCAASGVNVVAREGVAVAHPAEFMLVGTMNPEEGELRPQLQDRFGLCAEIRTLQEPETRAEIVDRVLEFERDPGAFDSKWAAEEKRLSESVGKARKLLHTIQPPRSLYTSAAELSISLGVHGHRADFLMIKASATLAALNGRKEINIDDLETAATLVYPHRLRRKPFDESPLSEEELKERTRQILSDSNPSSAQKKSPPERLA